MSTEYNPILVKIAEQTAKDLKTAIDALDETATNYITKLSSVILIAKAKANESIPAFLKDIAYIEVGVGEDTNKIYVGYQIIG